MWRLGRHDSRFNATMSLVVTLEGPVPSEALLGRLSRLCRAVPRLRHRVRESPLGVVPPAWEPDPSFAVEHHATEMPGPVWETAAAVVAEPFEEGRPPWRVVLTGTGTSHPALVLHLHHSYTDGLGGVRLLAELFDFQAGTPASEPSTERDRPAPDQPPAADQPPGPDPSSGVAGPGAPLDALLHDLEGEVRRAAGLWSRAVPWAVRTLAAARHEPERVLQAAAELADALLVHAGAAVGPSSPVLASRSAGVHLVPLRLDLQALRATAARLGATVNDVYLAGLLDGLERYHAKRGSVAPSLRLGLPISSRESDTDMRNQVIGAVVRGPLGGLDFDERARLVHEIVLHGRRQPWAALFEEAAAGAVRVPGAVRLLGAAMSSLDVLASNVIGPPVPMWLAGVPVTTMTPVGPRSGSAINATLLSYCGTAAVGLNIDPAAVPDPEVLQDCLVAAFDEAVGGWRRVGD